jgi:hypothetical protein
VEIKLEIASVLLKEEENIKNRLGEKEEISYRTDKKGVSVLSVIEELGISPEKISFVKINDRRSYFNKELQNVMLNDGDKVKVYPFLVGG